MVRGRRLGDRAVRAGLFPRGLRFALGDRGRLLGARGLRPGVLSARRWRDLFLSRSTVCSRNPPVVYPPLLIRGVAGVLDFLVLLAVNFALVWVTAEAASVLSPRWGFLVVSLLAFLYPFPTTWLYFAFQESSSRQATFGARACHLRVVDLDGARLSFARATGRHAARYVTFGSFGVGLLLWFFTPRRQALHDFLSGSVVVRDVPRAVVQALDVGFGAAPAVGGSRPLVAGTPV